MKILQLGKFYPIRGGVEKVMYDLTAGLSARGIHCDMLCASEKPQTLALNEYGRVICSKSLIKLAATMISPTMMLYLRKWNKEYDVIHVHHPDPMACLALFCSGYKGKVVLHWHSDILKQKLLLKFYQPLQNWLIRRADVIVGTTPVYVAQSKALQKVQHKVTYIPIGIEPMRPDAQGVQRIRDQYKGKKIVYSLGRLVGYKGYEFLVRAAQHLTDDYQILIGGGGPLKAELQQLIEELGVASRVKLLGFVPDEDLANYYGACDVYCLSSIWKTEAFAIVQIEAMSCGKPVVATRIPESGVSWVNKHGFSGLNVKPEDGKELADAIMELTRDEDYYKKMAAQARELYNERYVYAKMIDSCTELYKNVMKE